MRRMAAVLALSLFTLGLLACSQEEDVTLRASSTATSSPAETQSPIAIPTLTATPLPTGSPTPAAGCSEVYPPMTLTFSGPSNALAGTDLTYTLDYTGSPGSMHVNFSLLRLTAGNNPQPLSPDLTYVSSRRLSGAGEPEITPIMGDQKLIGLAWLVSEGPGELEFTLRIAPGSDTTSLRLGAYISGVCAPRSNLIVTELGAA